MSRVANNPIELPSGVEATMQGQLITIKGPKGQLQHNIHEFVSVEQDGSVLKVIQRDNYKNRSGSKNTLKGSVVALAGTTRALVNNIVIGVTKGFERKLSMVGVGYRAQVQGNKLNISAGFSHPVLFDIPEGIAITTPSQTEIVVAGVDKQKVGQVAANIRAIRSPEPYKGKGIRYADEYVAIKETKKK